KSCSAAVSWRIVRAIVWVAAEEGGRQRPLRFRTIQVCPNDLAVLLQQVERAVDQLSAPRRVGRRPMFGMRRREFITLLGGAASMWSLAARAQQTGKVPTIGFLGATTHSAWEHQVDAFVQRLRELGWSEGRTVAIEYRWGEGRPERLAAIAAELV